METNLFHLNGHQVLTGWNLKKTEIKAFSSFTDIFPSKSSLLALADIYIVIVCADSRRALEGKRESLELLQCTQMRNKTNL